MPGTEAAAKAGQPARPMAWRVVDFVERFEPHDDPSFDRTDPLPYVEWYIGTDPDHPLEPYRRQLESLKDKPDHHALRGCFDYLVLQTATLGHVHRGYLLAPDLSPASDELIAEWVHEADVDECRRFLAALAEAGLLERVELPAWPADE